MFVIVPTFSTSTDLGPLWESFRQFLVVLISPEMHQHLLPLKILFVFSGIGFIVIIIYLLLHTEYLKWSIYGDIKDFLTAGRKLLGITNQKNIQAWNKIKKGLEKEYEAQWKVSVIESFSFLEKILENAGYPGETLGERISKISPEDVSNTDKLMKDQEVYYDIIKDPNYRLTKEAAQEIIMDLEQSLKDLEML
jgi:hypothetical protein